MLTVLIVIAFIATAIFFLASRKPDNFEVTRTMVMAAPPARVFIEVNDLHRWEGWSPWAKMDPGAKTTYSGPDEGVGASMNWVGKKTGTGAMTVKESDLSSRVQLQLDFLKPMKATNIALFTFTPQGSGTLVSWSMYGKSKMLNKVMSLAMNCEKMVSGQFDRGLASLKTIVES